jgi:hypothetical protein
VLYPNLVWCIKQSIGSQYRLAGALGESETWLSHRLTGRLDFSDSDRERIAKALDYPEEWLFAKPTPPAHKKSTAQVCM